jgi:hypothetical protein
MMIPKMFGKVPSFCDVMTVVAFLVEENEACLLSPHNNLFNHSSCLCGDSFSSDTADAIY